MTVVSPPSPLPASNPVPTSDNTPTPFSNEPRPKTPPRIVHSSPIHLRTDRPEYSCSWLFILFQSEATRVEFAWVQRQPGGEVLWRTRICGPCTPMKMAETRYIQRKALEGGMVCYDGTVRNSLGDLIQFVYGEDSMDGAFIKRQNIDTGFLPGLYDLESGARVYMNCIPGDTAEHEATNGITGVDKQTISSPP
ncbi:hypothetical protein PILCRDRAFT_16304 [Piloderma croceum F 1598]|uniref:DNA-directed RNA polymerase n=1 Tax=Piloderma croceum (strain F 1598) TaxID=765440 RepID=A0A0C3EHY7_PILCF|nr:hypothetical protein PILCRDRAFT_16304 [Piloderma croceum F 1598]